MVVVNPVVILNTLFLRIRIISIMPFSKILVANRGEIACRIIRTAKHMGVRVAAVYSDQDVYAMHTNHADEAYRLGPAPAMESYLRGDIILDVAKQCGAEAVHPGYGFLSENADFADACLAGGITFIGPPSSAIAAMGSKSASKVIMQKAGVPVCPGYHGEDQSLKTLKEKAIMIGFPLLIKAVMGGGGKGMRVLESDKDFESALAACRQEAQSSFGDDRVILEKLVQATRHVEVQIFADSHGNCVHLHERDCSLQRRHQKVLEEAPAPLLSDKQRKKLGGLAVTAAQAVGYVGAGTVEFLVDSTTKNAYFCEMNTRLQVEHPVTELITGIDLVEWQLRIAAGEYLPVTQDEVTATGHAIEARIYAENPSNNFLPAAGKLNRLRLPSGQRVRVDSGVKEGDEVSVFYDPMIAKVIASGPDRHQAIKRLSGALRNFVVAGVPTNIDFCLACLSHPTFAEGGITTSFLSDHGNGIINASSSTGPEVQPGSVSMALATVAFVLSQRETSIGMVRGAWSPAVMGAWRAVGYRQASINGQLVVSYTSDRYQTTPPGLTSFSIDGIRIDASMGPTDPLLDDHADGLRTMHAIVDDSYSLKLLVDIRAAVRGSGTMLTLWNNSQLNNESCCAGGEDRDPAAKSRIPHCIEVVIPSIWEHNAGETNTHFGTIVSPMPGKVIKVTDSNSNNYSNPSEMMALRALKRSFCS